ncbi:hypothetical protein GALL_540940 [mine drainage metagenome]|uniref:Uncharacterized protein n=1 Tax=mine drainage metagenome TaxID=410659 RepID=A0A1J5PGH0_9ZZZZ
MRQGLVHGADGIQQIQTVTGEDLQVGEPSEIVAEVGIGALVPLGHRDAVAVVLHHEDHGQLLPVCPVDALVAVALGKRRFALAAEDHGILPVALHGAGQAYGVLGVVAREAGNVLDADGGLGEMVAHVPSAAGGIRGLGDAVQDDLLGGEARRQAGQQIAVVGEEEIPPRPEGQAQGQLDAIVPGTGRVVGPADGLLQVVGRLVIQHPSQMHELVPVAQILAAGAPIRSQRLQGHLHQGRRIQQSPPAPGCIRDLQTPTMVPRPHGNGS